MITKVYVGIIATVWVISVQFGVQLQGEITECYATINNQTEQLGVYALKMEQDKENLAQVVDEHDAECNGLTQVIESLEGILERDIAEGTLLGTFEATAYTDDANSQGKWVGQTATGRKPQVGVVAVDPRVIPLETDLFIEGYGYAVAGDVGGAIKGKRVDLFMDTRAECRSFGRNQLRVWIVNK